MSDDSFDHDVKEFLQKFVASDLTAEQLQHVVDGARAHLTRFVLDSNLPDPEDALRTYGIELDEDDLTAALEDSEERTSRLQPVLALVDSYATVITMHLVQVVVNDIMDGVSEEFLEHFSDFLSGIIQTAAICAVSGTLTELERRGDLIYMWELEDLS